MGGGPPGGRSFPCGGAARLLSGPGGGAVFSGRVHIVLAVLRDMQEKARVRAVPFFIDKRIPHGRSLEWAS